MPQRISLFTCSTATKSPAALTVLAFCCLISWVTTAFAAPSADNGPSVQAFHIGNEFKFSYPQVPLRNGVIFGVSVAISGDTALVGAMRDDGPNGEQGAAYVLVRDGSTWTQQAKLIASDTPAGSFFGHSVALSGDVALIGAPGGAGAAYVYVRNNGIWAQETRLAPIEGSVGEQFGYAVALADSTALIGVPSDVLGSSYGHGSAFVFTRSAGTWTQQQKLIASDAEPINYFGSAVALDGDTAVVGAPHDNFGSVSLQGSAYVFARSAGVWAEQAKLFAADGATFDLFGNAVAVSGDTVVAGAFVDDVNGNANQGSVHVYVRSGATWSSQAQLLMADGAANDQLGMGVAIQGDTLLAGARGDVVNGIGKGSVVFYTRTGNTWSQEQKLTASDGSGADIFGHALAISGDRLIVSAYGDEAPGDPQSTDSGSVYLFQLNPPTPPTFSPAAAIVRQQGSPATSATLGTVDDLTDPTGSLLVAITGDTTVGVTTTALTNTNGSVTAQIAASCTATGGDLTLQVSDLGGLTAADAVQINVSANTPPSLSYSAISVGVGTNSSHNPSAAPSDNGSVSSIAVQDVGTYGGGISVSGSGVIDLSNATPTGAHTITVRATDNCGVETDASFQLTINQATTSNIVTSDISPSHFGQALTLSAELSGVDPTGTVEFFAGAVSLGSAPLTTSPGGGSGLKLASLSISTLTVGDHNISGVYAGDINNLPSTSANLLHTVQATNTVMSLGPTANPAAVGNVAISVQVQAVAPGGGLPAGTVVISAGPANTCVAPLVAGSGSCTLNFSSAGYAAITASYTPANGNYLVSTGATSLVVVNSPSSTDLRVRIGNGVLTINSGQSVNYDIVVDNIGAQSAVGRLQVPLSTDYSSSTFSCQASGQASCGDNSTGTGSIDDEISLAPGGYVIYSLAVVAPLSPERTITQTASITTKTPTTDFNLANNQALDADPMGLFADGFEEQVIGE